MHNYISLSRTPKLLAESFQIGNTEHIRLLKEMGITVIQSNDGKVQLVHQAGTVSNLNLIFYIDFLLIK